MTDPALYLTADDGYHEGQPDRWSYTATQERLDRLKSLWQAVAEQRRNVV